MIAKVRSMATNENPPGILKSCWRWGRRQKRPPRKAAAREDSALQGGRHGAAQIRGSFDASDSGCGHGGVFVFGGPLAAADDGARVTHAAAWRGGLSGDEPDYRLFHVGFDEF